MIAERLKNLLDMRDVSQAEFAADVGITASAVSQYLSGDREPQTDVVLRICKKFRVSSDWLLGIDKRLPDHGVVGYFFCRKCDTRFRIMGLEKK